MNARVTGGQFLDGGAQKTPLGQSLHRLAAAKAQDVQALQGLHLPCTVSKVISPWIVEVNFEVAGPTLPNDLQVPVQAPPYISLPIKVGDPGIVQSATVRLGGLSGLGSGTPNLQDASGGIGNLSALSFTWLGTTDYDTIDPDAVVLHGNISVTPDKLGFFATSKVALQSLTGALSSVTDPAAQAVLQSIVDALCADNGYGLTKDETT